jgi:copper transport protein
VRLIASFAALIFLFLAFPTPALAHATAIRSDPAGACAATPVGASCESKTAVLDQPPTTVRVWFSEPVQPFGNGLIVTGPNGRRADRGPARLGGAVLGVDVDASTPGRYVVRWQVVGEDTHPSRGQFSFWVGPPTPGAAVDAEPTVSDVAPLGLALQALAHWLHVVGYALSFGVVAFQLIVARGAGSAGELDRRLRRLIDAGIVALLVAELLALVGQTASVDPAEIVDPLSVSAAFDSSFGRAISLRLGAALLLWMLLGFTNAGSGRGGPLILTVGIGLAFVDSASAHALSVRPAWLGLVVGALHLSAAGVWFGGIVGLLEIWREPRLKESRSAIARRFGTVALSSVLVLAVTGALTGWWHVGLADGGIVVGLASDYGRAVALKVAFTLGALAIVAFPGRKLRPTIARWWTAELLALVAVVAVAGLIVSLRPPA